MKMMGMGFMAFVSMLLLSVMAASSINLKEIKPQGINRVGEGTCSKNSVSISQGPADGAQTYGVEIVNVCTTQCDVSNLHVSCGAFSSDVSIDPKIFRRVNDNDCLVNDGQVIHSGETVSFKYSSSTQYPLRVSSLSCGN